nr:neurofilament medium polypeptide-like [Aegilops tauschii subsp. strangulata]
MPDFNAHGLDPNWIEPEDIQVQEFFDTLHEGYVIAELRLVQDTSQVELDYIAARAAEAKLTEEAGSTDGVEDKIATEVEENELTQWAEAAGEASSAGTGAPLVEDMVGESSEEEAEEEEVVAIDPPATGRGRVLRRATSGEPVRPGRAAELRQAQEMSARQTRAAAAKKVVTAAVAKEKASASSSAKRVQTPPPSPPPADVDAGVTFDFGSPNRPSTDQEDIDPIIEDVAKDAAAEAEKVAVEESAKGAAEDTAEGPAGEPAEADLKVRVAEAQTWFRQANEELKAAKGKLAKRDVELTMKLADIKKAQEAAEGLAAATEAARTQHQSKAREKILAKDLEAEKLERKNEAASHKDFVEGENR